MPLSPSEGARGGAGRCELCGREAPERTLHHLIPRTRHKNKRNKKTFSRQEVKERTALFCPPCHKTVHATLTEKELERDFNTVAALRTHPDLQSFIAWLQAHPDTAHIRVRQSARRRRQGWQRDRKGKW